MNKTLASALRLLLWGLVLAAAACVVGFVMSPEYPYDTIFFVSMGLLVVGCLASMHGGVRSPFGQFGGSANNVQGNSNVAPIPVEVQKDKDGFAVPFADSRRSEHRDRWPLVLLIGGLMGLLVVFVFGRM